MKKFTIGKLTEIKRTKINWQFTNKEASVKLKKLYPSIHV